MNVVNAAVAVVGALGADEHRAVGVDDGIDRRVAVAQAVGGLVLRDAGDGDGRIVIYIHDAEDADRLQAVIWRPEAGDARPRVHQDRRLIDALHGHGRDVAGSPAETVIHGQLKFQRRACGIHERRGKGRPSAAGRQHRERLRHFSQDQSARRSRHCHR